MRQIALPLMPDAQLGRATRIVIGNGNEEAIDAMRQPENWPFGTAVLSGPPRSGKSLLAQWFAQTGLGDVIDDADSVPEVELFHSWNRAQEAKRPLLLVSNAKDGSWKIALPDLASRLGAAMPLRIEAPDDDMVADLIAVHAEMRALVLDDSATAYLVPRCERSHLGIERLVAAIDRISLERKQAPTMTIWRDALDETMGPDQPTLP